MQEQSITRAPDLDLKNTIKNGGISIPGRKMTCSKCLKKLEENFVSKRFFSKRPEYFCNDECLKAYMGLS